MKNLSLIITIIILSIGLGLAVFWLQKENSKPGIYDKFAQCLKDKDAVFYGAFWCSHCQNQKAMFGKSAKLLPYVECSTADGKNQVLACKEKNIEAYPTWEFADRSRLTGEVSLDTLAEKTGCLLP